MKVEMGVLVSGGIGFQSNEVLWGEIRKDLCPHLIQPFLESINRGSRNEGNLFQYLVTLNEKADPLLLLPWSTLWATLGLMLVA